MSDWISGLWGVGGVVVGGVGTFLTTTLAEKRRLEADATQRKLDRDDVERKRVAELDEARRQRVHDLQFDVLRQLPEAVRSFQRSATLVVRADEDAIKATGNFTMLPDGVSDAMFDAGIKLRALAVEVLDDELREALYQYNSVANGYTMPPADNDDLTSEQRAALVDTRFRALGNDVEPLLNLVGEKVRAELAEASAS